MSYLSRFVMRRPSVRVDERVRLNLGGFHSLHRIATLLRELHRFEEALLAEARLAAERTGDGSTQTQTHQAITTP